MLTLALAAGALLAVPLSPDLAPRWLPEKSLEHAFASPSDPRSLVLKLADDAGARAVGGRLAPDFDDPRVAAALAVLDAFGGVRVEPLVDLPPSKLDGLRETGQARSGRALADMTQYFALTVPEGADPVALLLALHSLDVVENAYVAPPDPVLTALPGDVGVPTPDFTPQQGYRGPAPVGVDADHALLYVAGLGQNVTLADIEKDWHLTHEDLSSIDASDVIGTLPGAEIDLDRHHGTAIAGLAVADLDASGITGIAPGARFRMRSVLGSNVAAALLDAGFFLEAGDVALIEIAYAGPNWATFANGPFDQFGTVAVEYYDAEFNAIRTLVAGGIHVVEAAGNGSQGYDSDAPPTGHPSYPPLFDTAQRDSGAILVAAGSSTVPHTRLGFSNFGARVDVYSWGENVFTTGYGPAFGCDGFPAAGDDEDQFYDFCFSGTSSAAGIVAPVVAVVEGLYESLYASAYAPAALRGALRTTGTPGANAGMGTQPDLRSVLPRLGTGPLLTLQYVAPDLHENLFTVLGPDWNGDGFGEWFVGAAPEPSEDLQFVEPGLAQMRDGRSGELLFEWFGEEEGERFGAFLLTTSEGSFAELLVSAPEGLGRVDAFGLGDATRMFSVQGQTPDADFGAFLCELPDVDGDGWPDFAVSAPRGIGASKQAGNVQLFSGSTGAPLGQFFGLDGGERFGSSMVLTFDVDGLGLPDLVVGAPGPFASGTNDTGRIEVFSLETKSSLLELQGASSSSRFGESLASMPDVDGDGKPDLAVYAPGSNRVYRVSLFNGIVGAVYSSQRGPEDEEVPLGLSPTPDVDGGGETDLLVGVPGDDSEGDDAGAVYLISWETGQILEQYAGAWHGNRFGKMVSGGDLDGDGRGEVLVGSVANENKETGGPTAGGAYVYLGGPPDPAVLPPPPAILDVEPFAVEAVVPGGATVTLTGNGLEFAARLTVDGEELPTDEWHVNPEGGIEFRMPLVSLLGLVPIFVETPGGGALEQIVVSPNAQPTLDARVPLQDTFLPTEFPPPGTTEGVILITGSTPGDFAFTVASTIHSPSALPGLFSIDIGGGLQELFLLGSSPIGAKGWTQVTLPEVPILQQPYDAYFQAMTLDGQTLQFPLEETNVDSVLIGL